jgi:multidrug efflux system membrane fusion protein
MEGALHKTFLLLGVILAGMAAGVGEATFVGAQVTSQLYATFVVFSLPADSIPQIHARLKDGAIEVAAQDSDGKDLAVGNLSVIDNQIDRASGTIRFKASFDNTNAVLRRGQFVNIRVLEYKAIGEVVR